MSIEDIHQLRKRSEAFIANLDVHIANVVDYNEKLEELNRKQLKKSTLATGQKISRPYAHAYAAWKEHYFPQSYGSGKVNLLLTGELYKSLEITTRQGKEYDVKTNVPYAFKLATKYGDILGLKASSKAAFKITVPLLRKEWIKSVLK